jgi:predicted membrane protein
MLQYPHQQQEQLVKTRTRIMAWLYILIGLPFTIAAAIVVWLLMSFGTASITESLDLSTLPVWVGELLGTGAVYLGLIITVVVLVYLLPWIYLLKKRVWAWWFLTVTTTLTAIVALMPSAEERPSVPVIAILTLVLLLTDQPSSWKIKRRKRQR